MTITHRAGATDYGLLINGVEKLTVDTNGNLTVTGKVSQAVQSMVRLNTANGYGSTNTMIRRFTNVVTNQGSDITYADSATLGATFTINTNGVYAISYDDGFNASSDFGLTLNSAQLTTTINSIVLLPTILTISTTLAANSTMQVCATAYLSAGDVVRAHGSGTPNGTVPSRTNFLITKVA